MTIEEYFGDWSKIIDLKEAERVMRKLASSNASICPTIDNVFKAFRLCPLHKVRVILLGQDPYPNMRNGKPVATGIAFANSPNTPEESYSPSLDVLRESVINHTIPHRTTIFDPSLEKWEAQGVLLLNAALTCEFGKIGSHTLLWQPFMKSLLVNLSHYHSGLVYVLMGSIAQSYEPFIDEKFNHIIRIRHPSWYARNKTRMPSDTWDIINTLLEDLNGSRIEWYKEY